MVVRKAIPKEQDYLAELKKKASRPADSDVLPKFLIYARNKKGKSTFCVSAGVENILVIDPERGTDLMKKKNPYRIQVDRWQDLDNVHGGARTGNLSPASLGLGKNEDPFEWLALDGMTKFNNLALRYIMGIREERSLDSKPGIVDRRDYNKSGELMKEMMTKFHNLGMGVIFTAQEKMISMNTGDIEDDSDEPDESIYFAADLPPGVKGALNGIVDVIGRLYVIRVQIGEKLIPQRRLYIGPHEKYDTGYRSDWVLPNMIKNPTVPKLLTLIEDGKLPEKRKVTNASNQEGA